MGNKQAKRVYKNVNLALSHAKTAVNRARCGRETAPQNHPQAQECAMIKFYANIKAEQTMSGMRLNSIPKATIPTNRIEHTAHPADNF